jgi:GT2 family glycosyltransferase
VPLELTVIVTTYQRPGHLLRCLRSLSAQRGVAGRYEVIVVDDGSQDDTATCVARFARDASFPVTFLTHPHDGFQPGKGRNAGIRAAKAPYILFTDGDCVFPLDHLAQHLVARRPGVARAGDCYRLNQSQSELVDNRVLKLGDFGPFAGRAARRALGRVYRKTLLYQSLGSRTRPKVISWNMAAWRDDLLRVNGFDQRFRAWGCEDDDLGGRLRAAGVRVTTALGYTHGYHLWHALHTTTPQKWSDGLNVAYFTRPVCLARCLEGIERRELADLAVAVTSGNAHTALARDLAGRFAPPTARPEIELLLWSAAARFAKRADHRILVTAEGDPSVPAAVKRAAHATIQLGRQPNAEDLLAALDRLLAGRTAPALTSSTGDQQAA